jgi:putative flavoprotein involved in K+ transport
MNRTDVVVIGGGQAGLAMSRCLTDRGIEHVVLERGLVGQRWRSERWDSLRLLTPRWMSRLPGWSYRGPDPDGFMTRSEVVGYLEGYARSFPVPLHAGVTVRRVERDREGFRVETGAGPWRAGSVVIATGYCDRARVPAAAAALAPDIAQAVPTGYRSPAGLEEGGVLVVGASATGIQLASEIAAAGRPVTLAVGGHTRLPRRYRGRDILAWLDDLGVLAEPAAHVHDLAASRHQPSLQLVGSGDHHDLDLAVVQRQGVRLTGSLTAAGGRQVSLADDLGATIGHAEGKMHELLDRIDRFIAERGLDLAFPGAGRPGPVPVPEAPRGLDLGRAGIATVLWATGYRRDYRWLRVPVLDAHGELVHDGGVTPARGLYVLGLQLLRRRNSSFLDGVGADAADLADHIAERLGRRPVAA